MTTYISNWPAVVKVTDTGFCKLFPCAFTQPARCLSLSIVYSPFHRGTRDLCVGSGKESVEPKQVLLASR